jgi:hypothetical protein
LEQTVRLCLSILKSWLMHMQPVGTQCQRQQQHPRLPHKAQELTQPAKVTNPYSLVAHKRQPIRTPQQPKHLQPTRSRLQRRRMSEALLQPTTSYKGCLLT